MTRLIMIFLILALIASFAVLVINLRVASYASNRTFDSIDEVPSEDRVAIVLGARVENDGTPSNTLYDRVLTGVQLYHAAKTRKLLLSGGNTEPAVMKRLALELGVPESDMIVDDLGTRLMKRASVRSRSLVSAERSS